MPTALLSLEVVVGVLLLLGVAFLVATYVRRRRISGGRLLILCGWRHRAGDGWRTGYLRLGSSRLEWFSLLGLTTRPRYAWDRVLLDLDSPTLAALGDHVDPVDVVDLVPDAAPVRCTYGSETFELGLTPNAYTALRSWAEASPPGSSANVA